MFVELHLLQSFAPSNLNRDDTGSPKDAIFGGHRRARISSQAFKAAIRREPVFAEITQVPVGKRTKLMAAEVAGRLQKRKREAEQATTVAEAFAKAYAGKMDKGSKTNVLVYLSEEEFDRIATQLDANWETAVAEVTVDKPKEKIIGDLVKGFVKETKNRTSAPDIALFGRMLASNSTTNIDAASQVANAISTHRVNMEMDYFTAVDHLSGETGAGMVGFTSFNSACYYRYLRLDWEQLLKNLNCNVLLAQRTVKGFLRATMSAIPTGKQNSFAAQNPTDFAMAVVRSDGKSWNLVNAFESPIKAQSDPDTGYMEPSIRALDAYWHDLTSFYDDTRAEAVAVHVMNKHKPALNHLKAYWQENMTGWVSTVINALPQE